MRPRLAKLLCLVVLLLPLLTRAGHAVGAQYHGCAVVLTGPVCALEESGELVVWLDVHKADDVLWFVNDQSTLAEQVTTAAGGQRYSFSLATGSGTLRATTTKGHTLFELSLARAQPNLALGLAQTLMNNREFEQAMHTVVDALRVAQQMDLPRLLRMKARLHTRLGERAASHTNYRASIAAAKTVGDVSTSVLSAAALEFSLRQDIGDLDGAQSILDEVANVDRRHAGSNYLLNYHSAMIAYRRGDTRTHLALMKNAATQAARFGWTHRTVRADTRLAIQWQGLGRRDQAIAMLEQWRDKLPADYSGYHRAIFWTNLGWAYLLAQEAGEQTADTLSILRRALALALEHSSVTERINTHINLGLGLWHDGQFDAADDALQASRQYGVTPATHILYWSLDLEARIAFARGDAARALALYNQLLTLATANAALATAWRALVRRAWVQAQLGDSAAALQDFDEAQSMLDAQVQLVPVNEGRETLLATRRFATREHLELLLARGDNPAALALWRRAHARALRLAHVSAHLEQTSDRDQKRWAALRDRYTSLRDAVQREQIDSWTLSAEQLQRLELRAARTATQTRAILDEALAGITLQTDTHTNFQSSALPMVAFAEAADGWVVLIAQGSTVAAVRPACDELIDKALAQCLLSAAHPYLPIAPTTHLLVDESLAEIDWPALRFGHDQWIDHTALVYSAALPATQRRTPAPGHALLVGDPSGNLRAARLEVAHINKMVNATPDWMATIVSGEQATPLLVRELLANAALFHYAGHASFGDDLGWESSLHLANGSQLGVGDILTLDQVPQVVVLSGCETARKPGVSTPTMGLANAFLAAGSQSIIATSRAVDDVTARAVTSAFYANWLAGAAIPQALQSAQLTIKRTQPDADWSAFRLIQP